MTELLRIKQRNSARYIITSLSFILTSAVFLCFLIPLFTALFSGFFIDDSLSSFSVKGKYGFRNILKITFFTLKLASGSTVIAFIIGFPAAFFCAKRNFLFRKTLLGLSAVPLCIPVLIAALGFVSVFGLSGLLNKVYSCFSGGEKFRVLYSKWGIMISQGFYNFPLVMSMVSRYWENISDETENAARLLGASERQVFLKITFPELLPSVISSVVPVFLFCYFSFMIVLLFSAPGTSTLEIEIFQAVKTSLDMKLASKLALSETLTAFIILSLYIFLSGKFVKKEERYHCIKRSKIACAEYQSLFSKVLEIVMFSVLLILIIIFFVFPLSGILVSGFTARINGKDVISLNQYRILFSSKGFWISIRTTLFISFCTATVCTIISCVYALSLQKLEFSSKKINRNLFELMALFPMAVSSVVLGFGMTMVFKKGNELSLILVQSALFWPLSYRQINASLYKIPSDVYNSAQVLSGNYVESVFRVILPRIKRSLFASFGFSFAFSAGDTTLPLVLSIPKFQVLSLYTYRLSGSYRFNTACASGTVLAVICFTVFMISEKIGRINK